MINKKIVISCLFILAAGVGYGLTTKQVQYSQKALKALESKDYKTYYYLKSKLKNTDIYSYLQYKEINTNLGGFEQSTLDNYLNSNRDTYWSAELKNNLASYYADKHQWKLFETYYTGGLGISGKCWAMQSQYELEDKQAALKAYGKIWQSRVYMPPGCSEMQKYWDDSNNDNKLRSNLTNKAYTLAFASRFEDSLWVLNTYVGNNDDYVKYITAWKEVIEDPSRLDTFISQFHSYHNFNKIFVNLSENLIKKDAQAYAKNWDYLKNKKYLSLQTKQQCISAIAVSFARSQSPQAKKWLQKVDEKYLDTTAWEWLLRVDLYNNNYKDYIKSYYQMPTKSQQDAAWRYWLAYSYEQMGQKIKANDIFKQLIKEPLDYYSFLASDKLDQPYNFGDITSSSLSKVQAKQLVSQQPISQAIDLYEIGEYKDSTSLWKWEVRKKFRDHKMAEIKELSKLAENNDMYYAAIFSMAILGDYSNLRVLFPKAFLVDIDKNAQQFSIDRNLVLSIMRKESLFDIEAGSYAGAKGLMQVTEPTAKFIAKKYKLSLVGDRNKGMKKQIFIPQNNIKLGTANLYFLEKLFDKNLILGIGAYNAGPGNVDKWLAKKEVPAKQWIENIPFGETRHYIRKVLVYMIVYNNLIFDNKKDKLSDFLKGEISDKFSFR